MFRTFIQHLYQSCLYREGQSVLLAVSGGLDSMVMAHLFLRFRTKSGIDFPLAIAHLNYQLRGEESADDAAFVKAFAEQNDLPFYQKDVATRQLLEQSSESIQMLARRLRYAWWEELQAKLKFDYLATAHHANDNVETLLINLIHGTGIKGLGAIAPKSQGIIRPLLFATRAQIAEYAQANGILWREDSSNATDDYERNFLRHHLIPALKTLNPGLEHTFSHNIRHFADAYLLYHDSVGQWLNRLIKKEGERQSMARIALLQSPAPATLLYEWLAPYGLPPRLTEQLLAPTPDGSRLYHFGDSPSYTLLIDHQRFLLYPSEQGQPNELYFVVTAMENFPCSNAFFSVVARQLPAADLPRQIGKEEAYFDADRLRFPLVFRHWQQGDSFQPLGMKGQTKKLSDLFHDLKIALPDKHTQWLMCSEGAIAWLPGLRTDERFKVTQSTQRMLYLKFEMTRQNT